MSRHARCSEYCIRFRDRVFSERRRLCECYSASPGGNSGVESAGGYHRSVPPRITALSCTLSREGAAGPGSDDDGGCRISASGWQE